MVYFGVLRHGLVMISPKATILSEQNIVTLSVAEWLKVIRYVNASSDADNYMFVLRLWASAQVVKNTSYQAFDGLVGESASDLTAVTLRIEQITEWVEVAMGSSSALLDVRQFAPGHWFFKQTSRPLIGCFGLGLAAT
jgi:hypothetical protein